MEGVLVVGGFLVSRTKSNITISTQCEGVVSSRVITLGEREYTTFSNCAVNDIVSCTVTESSSGELQLSDRVLITRSIVEERHTIQSMIASVRSRGSLSVIPAKIVRLYKHIERSSLSAKLPTVSQFLSYCANLYNMGNKRDVVRLLDAASIASSEELGLVLRGWYMKNDVRLLKCLGFDEEAIRESYIRPDILYSLYMENPLLVYCAPLDRAMIDCELLEVDIASYKQAAIALRKLAEATVLRWGHSCVNSSTFYNSNKLEKPSIRQLLDRAVVHDVCDGDHVLYLRELREMEVYVAAQLQNIFTSKLPSVGTKRPERDTTLDIDREQDKAVEQALQYNVSIVNGAAGTGKTTIIKKILTCLNMNGVSFACTSFTGCATARITECTGIDAADMDMMIIRSSDYNFSHLIIDEFSMTNIKLMYLFLQAFPGPYRITIIGDVQQLEPIGPGSILKQLIKSNCIPVTTLRTIHRVKTRDGVMDRIIENSKRIAYWEDKPFSFIEGDNFEIREGTIGTLMLEIKSLYSTGAALSDFVIISPWKKPIALINRAVQLTYNMSTKCCIQKGRQWLIQDREYKRILDIGGLVYHVGDRVMILKNKDEPKMFNGQEGRVTDVLEDGVEVEVRRRVLNDSGEWEEIVTRILFPFVGKRDDENSLNISFITLSYACTVHKMQGKQCKLAIYYLDEECCSTTNGPSSFVTRNMTYTAITRAEERVLLIGRPTHFNRSVNNVPKDKKEYLYWRLRELLPQDFCPVKDDRMMEELLERQRLNNLAAAAENDDSGDYGDEDWSD